LYGKKFSHKVFISNNMKVCCMCCEYSVTLKLDEVSFAYNCGNLKQYL